MRSVEERFWSKVDMSGGSESCWPWQGPSRAEYNHTGARRGVTTLNGKRVYAPRAAYELSSGHAVQPGMHVLHSCDNPICVNPAHLHAGSLSENQHERVARGRHGPAGRVLDEDKVREIHRLLLRGAYNSTLAYMFGVSPKQISTIRNGHQWRSIYEEFHQAVAA